PEMTEESASTLSQHTQQSLKPQVDPRWYFPGFGYVSKASRPSVLRNYPRRLDTREMHWLYLCPGRGAGGGGDWLQSDRDGPRWIRKLDVPNLDQGTGGEHVHQNRQIRSRAPASAPSNSDFNFNDPLPDPAPGVPQLCTPVSNTTLNLSQPHSDFSHNSMHCLDQSMINPYFSPWQTPHHVLAQQQHLPSDALPQAQPLSPTFDPNFFFPVPAPNRRAPPVVLTRRVYSHSNLFPQDLLLYGGQQPPTEQNYDSHSLGRRSRNHSLTQRQALRYGDLSI
ncbi:hypothetical protein JCM5353_003606, partial [Sporobolomyces roseus]